ncbi:uncharacterized protein BDV14DRAFT_167133 [Aspergillus stella-maris]|uniref:uncharacterized protein n=1 Tax=Aspergillus stella-maris TaxID=1810926 RepID=UPI003CCCD6CC
MQIFKQSAALAALSLPFLTLVSAREVCEGNLVISAQEHLDIIGRDCRTIVGYLGFNQSYTGSFELRGVENITGAIAPTDYGKPFLERQLQVTEVSLPDMKHIGELDFLLAAQLHNVSAPNLETAEMIWLSEVADGCVVDFPKLRELDYLTFRGNYSRLEVPELRNVTSNLRIEDVKITNDGLLDVSLPSLESTWLFNVTGQTTGVSALKLKTVGDSLTVTLHESPASLSLPALESVGSELDINGAIASLDLGSLLNTEATITIDTATPLNISLPLKSWPSFLGFFGAIEGLSLPNIEGFNRVRIESELPLDCAALDEFFEPIVANITDVKWEVQNRYSCNSTAVNESGAYRPRIAGTAGAVPVAMAMVVGLLLW